MSERGALVRPRLPYFPTIMEALSRLVDGADTPSQSGEDYSDLHLNMFVLDPRARIPRVTVRAGHAEVSVAGEVLPEMELKMYSNTSELSLALDPSRETYEFAWSEIPEYAEWVTTEGNEVIDRRIFSRHPQFGANVNVVTDYGDPTTLGYFLQEGETRTIEFKENLPNEEKAKRSLLETVCAFANTEGGTILIGVSDHGSVHGVAEDTRWKDRLTDIIRNRMEPVPLFTFQELDYKEARIYCIRVMAGNDRPYVVDIQDPKIYVRHGANDYVARRADLDEMYAAKQQSSILSVHLDDTPFSR